MEIGFFLKQMVGLLNASICVCNPGKMTRKEIGSEEVEKNFSQEEAEVLHTNFVLEKTDYPVIRVLDKELILIEIWSEKQPDEWICVGPVVPAFIGIESFRRICKKHKAIEKMGFRIQMCQLDTLVSGVLLLFWAVTGKELTATELLERNQEWSEKIQKSVSRVAKDMFYRQENYGPHNPYEQEMREVESIKNGDVEALKRSIAETYAGEIGILAKDPLRHYKNVAIGNITLASRAAIRGGVSVEESFSMADSYIQQIEELDNIPEVEMFKREAQYAYARVVAEEKASGPAVKNPLIAGVKDYVFSHLHDAIQIADIAEHLHVNADYLSHLFSTQENITIKKYILQEKVKRSKNLLKYSDYHLQEIGFYLGFSSQSHFSKTFSEIVGMTPNEYRKKFNNREKWKII